MFDSLSAFIDALEDDRDLIRIPVEVDPAGELAEITTRIAAIPDGGPALLFEKIRGRNVPVVANLLGAERRLCRALGIRTCEELSQRLAGLIQPDLPSGWFDALKIVPRMAQLTRIPPRQVKSGVCQQVVRMGRDVDLRELPIPTHWPGDAGPALSAAQIITCHPENRQQHVENCLVEVCGQSSLLIHWTPHHRGYQHYCQHAALARQMPVALALGGDPLQLFLALAPLPADTSASLFAGFVRGHAVELVACRSIDLQVPADAEFVLEGQIDVGAPLQKSGRLGGLTGYYSEPRELPAVQLTALTHRTNPLFPVMIPGPPPAEQFWIAGAIERIFLPFVRLFAPEIAGVHLPRAGSCRSLLFVSIDKQYPGQARKVMHGLWGLYPLLYAKLIVVVDADVDVHNEEDVWRAVGANLHPGRDVVTADGPAHYEDHAAPVAGVGQKIGLDATRKGRDEGHPRDWPEQVRPRADVAEAVSRRWKDYGLARLSQPVEPRAANEHPAIPADSE